MNASGSTPMPAPQERTANCDDTGSLACVLVTYHPDSDILRRQIEALPADCALVIVDNASGAAVDHRGLWRASGVSLSESDGNLPNPQLHSASAAGHPALSLLKTVIQIEKARLRAFRILLP
jgi:hypothetical protein